MDNKEVEMDAAAPARDEFQTQLQEQYLKSLEGLEEGDLVDGHVIQVTNDFALQEITRCRLLIDYLILEVEPACLCHFDEGSRPRFKIGNNFFNELPIARIRTHTLPKG